MMTSLIPFILTGLSLIGCSGATEHTPPTAQQTKDSPAMPTISKSGFDLTRPNPSSHAAMLESLSPEIIEVTQRAGTEQQFCGTLLDNKQVGTYTCVVCGLPLFSSEHKYTSGTGWPSFFQPFDDDHVARVEDRAHGMVRTEIECARCTSHLGHVFPDGPPPTGERHCLNSAALVFHETGSDLPSTMQPIATETAYFAGGCFWGIEHYFQQGSGVIEATSGYMQGDDAKATYDAVCAGTSGHAESVKVVFNPAEITYKDLVEAFFRMHNPIEVNRQGPDVGTQYRSGIWFTSPLQHKIATDAIRSLSASGQYAAPLATQVEPAATFHAAENYHQDYIARTGRACHIADPWADTTQSTPKD
jgi:peptide methionine sulfoxide reductase msrA/msrB